MKRDMKLIREMLLAIESTPAGKLYAIEDDPIEGHDIATLQGHLRLLDDAGFVAKIHLTRGGGGCSGLTWAGHEFLDASRSPSVWAKAMKQVQQIGGSVSVSVLQSLLVKIASQELGLD